MDDFLDLSRTVPVAQSTGRFVLHLVGGDQTGGGAGRFEGRYTDLEELRNWARFRFREAGWLQSPGRTTAPTERQHEDVVRLSNGTRSHGIIAAMSRRLDHRANQQRQQRSADEFRRLD